MAFVKGERVRNPDGTKHGTIMEACDKNLNVLLGNMPIRSGRRVVVQWDGELSASYVLTDNIVLFIKETEE
tara:strand:- start:70 stop:282 length:213 start_codon:yes stop_codon:yes gene_type:complete